MDSVSLRTASMKWNVPAKYGPHGELFFFLIQRELATMLGSETLVLSSHRGRAATAKGCGERKQQVKKEAEQVVVD